MSYPGILMGETPAAMREDAVRRILVPMAESAFAARPDVQSLLLAVAQYWNDEADDAVHASVHYSRRHTPVWPHECPYFADDAGTASDRADFCNWCGGQVPGHPANPEWVPWDDNGSAIPAFEAFCREACHQEMTTGEAYLPYAVVRRGQGVEIVGRPVRPWAERRESIEHAPPSGQLAELLAAVYAAPYEDGPRSVLADWLLEQGDPIGELIALQLKKSDHRTVSDVIAQHGRRWIGRIEPVIAPGGAVFRRGFLAEAELFFGSQQDVASYGSDPRWGTVERIHFLSGSAQALHPSMRALRAVSGIEDDALAEIATSASPWPIQDLALQLEERRSFAAIGSSTAFPALRRLEIGGRALRAYEVVQLLREPAGAALARLAVANVEDAQVPSWLDALDRFTSLSAFEVTQRLDAGRRAGWTISFERGADGRLSRMRARLDNLAGDGRIERVCDLIEVLPRDALVHVLLERTELFDPMVEDEVRLREAAVSQRRFQGVEVR